MDAVSNPKSGWSSPVIASTLIAIASTLIASAALGLAIYNAHLDRQYKELSIKPHLELDVQSDDFHAAVMNNGVGPAEIKRIATKFGDTCSFLNEPPHDKFDKLVFETIHNIGDWFNDPLDQLVQPSIWEPTIRKVDVQVLTPKEILAPRQKIVLFKLRQQQSEAARQKLESLDADSFNKIVERFLDRARAMPYYAEYCSLTGDYCVGAETIQKACPH